MERFMGLASGAGCGQRMRDEEAHGLSQQAAERPGVRQISW